MAHDLLAPALWNTFARLLDYPGPDLAEAAREGARRASPVSPRAATLLAEFAAFLVSAADRRPADLEEAYTRAFELDPLYCPYVGHHLFGESYKRSLFLVGLKERFRAHGFSADHELPDHLAVLLRYLALLGEGEEREELIGEALLPALQALLEENRPHQARPWAPPHEVPARGAPGTPQPPRVRPATRRENPYRKVLEALRLVLEAEVPGRIREPLRSDLELPALQGWGEE